MEKNAILMLKEKAAKIRMMSVEAVYGAKSGHPGGSLSIADLIAYLYFHKMNVDPKNPEIIKTVWGVGYMIEEYRF